MKSDQDQSQGLKKQKKGLFDFGNRSKKQSERQRQKRQAKTQSLDTTNHNSSRQRRLTRQESPSSSFTSQLNLSMHTIKPPSANSTPVNPQNSAKNPELDQKKLDSKKGLFNLDFSPKRARSQSNSKTRAKSITSNSTSVSSALPPEIKPKVSSTRHQRRQKSKKIQALPLKSIQNPVQNNIQNTIVKRPSTSGRNTGVQLPSTSSRLNSQGKNQRKPRKKPASPFIYLIRLLILGIAIGAIVGTVLSIFDSNHSVLTQETLPKKENSQKTKTQSFKPPTLDKEIIPLKDELKTLTDQYPDLTAGIFMVDLDSKGYIDVQGATSVSAASTIKIPILMAFFEDVDDGKIRLDEQLIMEQDVIGGGSGDMQYQEVGKSFSALETATKMIVISDNTATNMLIKRLGGKDELNRRFQQWGLTTTIINNYLPDLEGTNTTSPKDLANMLGLVNQGDILSLRSRDRVLEIMRQTKTRTLLPQGLGEGASIAHKTGDIGTVLGDAGVIDMPNGKRYLASVLVTRPHNDIRGRTLIQEISRTIYRYLEKHPDHTTPIPTPSPTPTTSNP